MDVDRQRGGESAPARSTRGGGENQPVPLWFGLAFLAAGLGTIWSFFAVGGDLGDIIGPGFIVVAVGVLFALIGAGLALTRLTAARGRRPEHAMTAGGPNDVFTRSPMRILVDLVLAPVGGLGFLAFAPVWLQLGGVMGLVAAAMFVFFGIIVLWGSITTMRRGIRRAVAEVGPAGIWTPELPRRLAWSEIERVEVEITRGSAGEAGLALYRRLAIWPRDPAIVARAPGRRLAGVIRGFISLGNVRPGGAGISDPSKMAPFGIQAYEIEQDFSEVLRSVGRYARVLGVPADPDGPLDGPVVEPAPPPRGLVGEVLMNLAGREPDGLPHLRRQLPEGSPPIDVALPVDAPPVDAPPPAAPVGTPEPR